MNTGKRYGRTLKKEPKKLLEKDIQKLIIGYLNLKKVPHAVTNAERVWNPQGFVRKSKVSPDWPDLSCTLPIHMDNKPIGISFYIEVKTPTGSIREGQKIKLMELADAGALVILARSLEDVRVIVERFQGAELDYGAFKVVRTLLELKLGDKRAKSVRDAITSYTLQLSTAGKI